MTGPAAFFDGIGISVTGAGSGRITAGSLSQVGSVNSGATGVTSVGGITMSHGASAASKSPSITSTPWSSPSKVKPLSAVKVTTQCPPGAELPLTTNVAF